MTAPPGAAWATAAIATAAERIRQAAQPASASRRGRAGVLAARALYRVLAPFTWRSMAAQEAILEGVRAVDYSLQALREEMTNHTQQIEARLGQLETRVRHLGQAVQSVPSSTFPRLPKSTPAIVHADAVLMSSFPHRAAWDPIGATTIPTDVGAMWAHDADTVMTPALKAEGRWEPDLAAALRSFLRPGMTALDVGSNIGYVSLTMAMAVGPLGRVISLEPEPANFELLCANISRHDASCIQPVRAAAGRETGTATLWLSPSNLGDHRSWPSEETPHEISVPRLRLDDLLSPDVHIDVVKIDTQGSDHLVIQGMEGAIHRSHPVIFAEFWPKGLDGLDVRWKDVLAYYRSLRFTLSVVEDQSVPGESDDAIIDFTFQTPGGHCTLMLSPPGA